MIIQYDQRPNANIDEKLKSLIESIQLAFSEVGIKENAYRTSQDIDMNTVVTMLREFSETIGTLNSAVTNLGDRVGTLEDTTIPGIQGDVGDLDDRLDTLEGTVGGHTTDISGLDGRLDTLEDTTIPGIQGDISTLEDTTIPGIDTRVGALEGVIPAAPAVDGVYKLTVTVTSGVPAYTWELVV